ncbi:hypothetical protein RHSIM_Rhsim07G0088600 [Rhododendron simsii]|uniref:Uncharacterized protein n=1 Tax=Rhododendron simsii TaxID=118357 RepID=A0A834LLF6_RHOSS|nr:hypothetical protein RHSIM_Rhsim07G0088600 [Rhododendron simsii]
MFAAAEEKETHSFEIHPAQVDLVQSFETDQRESNELVWQRVNVIFVASLLYFTFLACSCQSQETEGHLQDRMAGGKEEYNAFFYSLVSTDTQVITSLPPPDLGANMCYHGLNEATGPPGEGIERS